MVYNVVFWFLVVASAIYYVVWIMEDNIFDDLPYIFMWILMLSVVATILGIGV